MYFGLDPFRPRESDPDIWLEVMLYASMALVFVSFTSAIIVSGSQTTKECERAVPPVYSIDRISTTAVCLIAGLCISVGISFLLQLERIPIFHIFNETLDQPLLRSRATNDFPGSQWRYRLFYSDLFLFCLLYLFAQSMLTQQRLATLSFSFLAPIYAFFAISLGQKAPLALMIIAIYLVVVQVRGGNFLQKELKWLAPLIAGIIILLYLSIKQTVSPEQVLFHAASRVLTGQLVPAYYYVSFIPERIDFLLGQSFPNPGGLLWHTPVALTREIYILVYPEIAARGVVGSMPTAFWGEAYANFGLVGIAFSSILMGAILGTIDRLRTLLPASPSLIAFSAWLALHYATMAITGIFSFVFDLGVLLVSLVVGLLFILDRHLTRSNAARS